MGTLTFIQQDTREQLRGMIKPRPGELQQQKQSIFNIQMSHTWCWIPKRKLIMILSCFYQHDIMISHKLATMTNALLNVSVMCQKHKASVLRYEKWAVFLSRRVCWSVCVSSSCQNILSNPPTGWSSTVPRCLTTIKAFSHLVFSEHLVIKFTAKCHKKTKKNTNTKYTLDVQINTLPFWLSWLFTWPCLSLWHHQLEGRKEHGNQTSGDDVSRPVLPDGVWIERVRAGALAVVTGAY